MLLGASDKACIAFDVWLDVDLMFSSNLLMRLSNTEITSGRVSLRDVSGTEEDDEVDDIFDGCLCVELGAGVGAGGFIPARRRIAAAFELLISM
jgi:hypothetical protein